MEVVLDSPTLRDIVLATGYIKNDNEVNMAFTNVHKHDRILVCASTSTGKTKRHMEEQSGFVNSVLIANT